MSKKVTLSVAAIFALVAATCFISRSAVEGRGVEVGHKRSEVEAFLKSEGMEFSYLNRHIAARKKVRDFIFMHTHLSYTIEFDENDIVESVVKKHVHTGL